MVSVRDLTKRYGAETVVDHLTFEVRPGEVLGLLGPNGAGKTTTMRMITGFLPPTEGRVTIDGLDLCDRPIEAKRLMGYLPEHPPLYADMTTRRYLQFVAEIKDVPGERRREAVTRAMERTGLLEVERKRISKLSKGFRQRVGLAQAIVHDPRVLVLDEPTSSLDPRQRVEVHALIQALRGRHTVIISTHILSEISDLADRVFILHHGRVVAVDSPDTLARRLRSRDVVVAEVQQPGAPDAAFAEAVRRLLAAVPGTIQVEVNALADGHVRARVESEPGYDLRADIATLITSRGWRLMGLASDAMSLEDVFLALTGEE